MSTADHLPRVLALGTPPPGVQGLLRDRVQWVFPETLASAAPDPHRQNDDVSGIYCYGPWPVDAALLDRFPAVRVISNHGVGVDHIDLEAARQRGIPVGNTPSVLDGAVADMAFALILAAARRVVEGDRHARHPEVSEFSADERHGRDVHGATLGIIGLGNIGFQIARRARGFDMRILYHSRRPREAAARQVGAQRVPLDELLAQSDFVVVIVPLTPETQKLIGRRELALMKPTATLVNVARGGVVDTEALTETLLAGRLFAAALDVTEPEPLPRDHPLLSLDNVTLTPHVGSATVQTRRRMGELSVENLLAGLEGRPLTCQIA